MRPSRFPSELSLVPATSGDAEGVADVLAAAFGGYEARYTAAAYRATVISAAGIAKRLGEGATWGAKLGDEVVGTVSCVLTGDGLYVRSMAVSPAAQGRGVGRALLDEVQSYARQSAASRLYLSTTPLLTAAIGLYESFGFRRVAGGPSELHGT